MAAVVSLALAFSLSGCVNVATYTQPTLIRVIDASYVAPPINVLVEGDSIAGNVGQGTISPYATLPASLDASIKIANAATGDSLTTTSNPLLAGHQYSVFLADLAGTPSGYTVSVLTDQQISAPTGHSAFRFLNQAIATGPVDVYMIPTGITLANSNPIVADLPVGAIEQLHRLQFADRDHGCHARRQNNAQLHFHCHLPGWRRSAHRAAGRRPVDHQPARSGLLRQRRELSRAHPTDEFPFAASSASSPVSPALFLRARPNPAPQPTPIASSTPTRTTRRPSRRASSTSTDTSTRAPVLNGRSTLRMDDLETGRVLQSLPVPSQILRRRPHRLGQHARPTHLAGAHRLRLRPLQLSPAAHLPLHGEGWGLTHDGKDLILSDGTATLRFLDPETFREVRHIVVKDHGSPVTQLNELEFVHGQIYANVWHTDRIARISPATGKVLGWIDLSGLLPASERIRHTEPSSTASPRTPHTTASSSPANSGQSFLKSKSFLKQPKPVPAKRPK